MSVVSNYRKLGTGGYFWCVAANECQVCLAFQFYYTGDCSINLDRQQRMHVCRAEVKFTYSWYFRTCGTRFVTYQFAVHAFNKHHYELWSSQWDWQLIGVLFYFTCYWYLWRCRRMLIHPQLCQMPKQRRLKPKLLPQIQTRSCLWSLRRSSDFCQFLMLTFFAVLWLYELSPGVIVFYMWHWYSTH